MNLAAWPGIAKAKFSFFYTAGQPSYTASAGSLLSVPVYIEERGFDQVNLINANSGLGTAAFSASVVSGGSSLTEVTGNSGNILAGIGDPTGFNSIVIHPPLDGIASVYEIELPDSGLGAQTAPLLSSTTEDVLLGNLTVQVGPAGNVTTFQVGPGAGGTFTNSPGYFDLDDNTGETSLYNAAVATRFTVTAIGGVPEPAGLATCGALAAFLARRQSRGAR